MPMRVSLLAALAALAVLSAAPAFANGPIMSSGSVGATTSTTAPPPDYSRYGSQPGSAGSGNRGRIVRDYDDYNRRATGSSYDYRPRLRDAHFLGSDVVSDRYDGPRRHHWSNDGARDKALRKYLNGLGW